MEASRAKGKRATNRGTNIAVDQERGVGSSPTTGPSPVEVAFDGLDMVALSFHKEGLELVEDFFVWPYPVNLGEALFVVDDTAK